MAIIEFQKVSKAYKQGEEVIKDLDFLVEEGEFITLLGESGCGKTTLLKMINRMISFDTGFIRVKGKLLSEWDTVALRREIGYVIQQIGLFPHMMIWENISYVLMLQGIPQKERRNRAEDLITLVGLPKFYLNRYPRELSGGQKQRVGVARALAANPDIILMDEPFGAVDERTRSQLQDELLRIHQELHKTILFVTHDIYEAMKLGTRIVLLNEGKIEQTGSKEELVLKPANDFVRSFLGSKGFTAILDETVIAEAYEKILREEAGLENFYQKMGQ
jgi:osmoprotectant transport system ATP-binding protein